MAKSTGTAMSSSPPPPVVPPLVGPRALLLQPAINAKKTSHFMGGAYSVEKTVSSAAAHAQPSDQLLELPTQVRIFDLGEGARQLLRHRLRHVEQLLARPRGGAAPL